MSRVLYALLTGAPPTLQASQLVKMAQALGWDVCLIASPTAMTFLGDHVHRLATWTGHPVCSTYKTPGQSDVLPEPDALLVAPATANTLRKWSLGISDTLLLGQLTKATGRLLRTGRPPIVAVPFMSVDQAAFPPYTDAIELLRTWGVHVVDRPYHRSNSGNVAALTFSWAEALAATEWLIEHTEREEVAP